MNRLTLRVERTDPAARSDLVLCALGLLLAVALLLFWACTGVWRGSARLIPGFFLPCAVFGLAVWWVLRVRRPPASWWTRLVLLGFSAVFHVILLVTPQPLSNDLYRYYWDGKLLAHGVNPYTYPPAAQELEAYRDVYWDLVFNPDVPTGYPPLSELVFAGAYALDIGPWALRLLASIASLAAGAVLMRALGTVGSDERLALIYAWSPLVVVEFANSAHLDVYALLCMSIALLFALRHRSVAAAVCLAFGGLFKFFPLLLMPIWGRRWGKAAWLAFILVFALPWMPFLSGGTPFTGLGIFASRGDFNGSLYRAIEHGWYLVVQSGEARLWARASIFITLAGVGIGVAWKQRLHFDVLSGWRFAGFFMGLCLLLSPVVHPWYICWMLVFASFTRQLAWVVLSVTVIFARHVYIGYEQTGLWEESWWPHLAVWIPFYLAVALTWLSEIVPGMKQQVHTQLRTVLSLTRPAGTPRARK